METRELIKRIQEGDDQAVKIICEQNLGLVTDMAKKYGKKIDNNMLETDDLIQAGIIGLVWAARKFDLSKENEFSTYAVSWIKKYIIEELRQNKYQVHLSNREKELIRKVTEKDKQNAITEPDGQKRLVLIAEELKITVDKVRECLNTNYQMQVRSLDEPYGEDENTCRKDQIPSTREESSEKQIINRDLQLRIKSMLHMLGEQEQRVIQYRYCGLDGKTKSFEEVASLMGLSREKVRRIDAMAMKKLEKSANKQDMKDFLG